MTSALSQLWLQRDVTLLLCTAKIICSRMFDSCLAAAADSYTARYVHHHVCEQPSSSQSEV